MAYSQRVLCRSRTQLSELPSHTLSRNRKRLLIHATDAMDTVHRPRESQDQTIRTMRQVTTETTRPDFSRSTTRSRTTVATRPYLRAESVTTPMLQQPAMALSPE